jgi:hypothetical protein
LRQDTCPLNTPHATPSHQASQNKNTCGLTLCCQATYRQHIGSYCMPPPSADSFCHSHPPTNQAYAAVPHDDIDNEACNAG